jgi:hypothetical protein
MQVSIPSGGSKYPGVKQLVDTVVSEELDLAGVVPPEEEEEVPMIVLPQTGTPPIVLKSPAHSSM